MKQSLDPLSRRSFPVPFSPLPPRVEDLACSQCHVRGSASILITGRESPTYVSRRAVAQLPGVIPKLVARVAMRRWAGAGRHAAAAHHGREAAYVAHGL